MGIAKDGNIIYGPFDANGNPWSTSDVDVCNGLFINGQYSYVATTFFPYFLGCWGPGTPRSARPSCTLNSFGIENIQSFVMTMTITSLLVMGLFWFF